MPSWFIDWFYVLFVSQRAVWQMISIALLSMVTADLDSPFHGLIKIRLRALAAVVTLVDETMLQDCIVEGDDSGWVDQQPDLGSFKEARARRRRPESRTCQRPY